MNLSALGTGPSTQSLVTALGLGLLVGVVRERLDERNGSAIAGVRTHALVAVLAVVAATLGTAVLVAAFLLTGALAVASYLRTSDDDPGLTGEVALLVTCLLAALAHQNATLAAALGVVVAALLLAKSPLHRFAREVVSERELQDALLLAGAALVVLPLLPKTPIDPWGVVAPAKLWRFVVLVMAVGMLGHVTLRAVGSRWGLPLAGFFSGFVSSTAAVAGFGRRAKEDGSHLLPALSAALFANLASLTLLAGVLGAGAPTLLLSAASPLGAAGGVLLVAGLLGLRSSQNATLPTAPSTRAFQVRHALLLAALVAALLLLSAWLRHLLGETGALVAAACVALAEIHAAGASLAQLFGAGELSLDHARWGVVALLGTSTLAKTGVAFASGGRAYAVRLGVGLFAAALAAAIAAWVAPV